MRLDELPRWAVPAACSAVAFGVGTAVGHILTKRRYKTVVVEVEDTAQLSFDFNSTEFDREINKATYVVRKMRDESENLMATVRDIATLQGVPVSPSRENHPSNQRPDPKLIVVASQEEKIETADGEIVGVFVDAEVDDDWDYEVELQNRDPVYPYIIHRDEFFNDEMGYGDKGDQRTFTFYAGDEILTDEKDIPIYDQVARVGTLRFGHGSGDPNLVYVRNEKEQEEYEIVLDDGAYEIVVLGGQVADDMENMDLKHSRHPAKFRRDD
jgi:hypothetical protein